MKEKKKKKKSPSISAYSNKGRLLDSFGIPLLQPHFKKTEMLSFVYFIQLNPLSLFFQ